MDDTSNQARDGRLSRRAFLNGAAGLAGCLAFDLNAWAAPDSVAVSAAPLTLAYWDGAALHDAASLPHGDQAFVGPGARVTIHSEVGASRTLRGVSAVYALDDGKTSVFHAWAGSPHGKHDAAFTVPVVDSGLTLIVRHTRTPENVPEDAVCRLAVSHEHNVPKLRAGTYILASRAVDWSRWQFQPDGPTRGRLVAGAAQKPAHFDYLVLTIASV
jgi:hypothetical protein